jgi:hypothetical protein
MVRHPGINLFLSVLEYPPDRYILHSPRTFNVSTNSRLKSCRITFTESHARSKRKSSVTESRSEYELEREKGLHFALQIGPCFVALEHVVLHCLAIVLLSRPLEHHQKAWKYLANSWIPHCSKRPPTQAIIH